MYPKTYEEPKPLTSQQKHRIENYYNVDRLSCTQIAAKTDSTPEQVYDHLNRKGLLRSSEETKKIREEKKGKNIEEERMESAMEDYRDTGIGLQKLSKKHHIPYEVLRAEATKRGILNPRKVGRPPLPTTQEILNGDLPYLLFAKFIVLKTREKVQQALKVDATTSSRIFNAFGFPTLIRCAWKERPKLIEKMVDHARDIIKDHLSAEEARAYAAERFKNPVKKVEPGIKIDIQNTPQLQHHSKTTPMISDMPVEEAIKMLHNHEQRIRELGDVEERMKKELVDIFTERNKTIREHADEMVKLGGITKVLTQEIQKLETWVGNLDAERSKWYEMFNKLDKEVKEMASITGFIIDPERTIKELQASMPPGVRMIITKPEGATRKDD